MEIKHVMNILIIGTEPPCSRCDLLHLLVEKVIPPEAMGTLQFCGYDSPMAKEFGAKTGYKIGTAKHVAEEANILIDWTFITHLIESKKASSALDSRPAEWWTPELDLALKPCQQVAEKTGYLMTPILVVNEKVVHHGSVPSRAQLKDWLLGNNP